MPLSPEQEWTLAACGLVAHADGIVEAGEWDRVLWMLDDRVGDDDASAWVTLLADRGRLQAHVDELAPPMPFFCEAILEKAWRMALADGEGSEQEAAVHDALAVKLGIGASDVASMRERWMTQAYRRSELVAGFAAILANPRWPARSLRGSGARCADRAPPRPGGAPRRAGRPPRAAARPSTESWGS